MAWDIQQTYHYLVCFATLMMMIIGITQGVRHSLDLAFPEEPYRPSPADIYQRSMRPGPEADTTMPFTREELEVMAEEESERNLRQAKRRAMRNLIGNVALVLIAAPVYVYHWRRVRRHE